MKGKQIQKYFKIYDETTSHYEIKSIAKNIFTHLHSISDQLEEETSVSKSFLEIVDYFSFVFE